MNLDSQGGVSIIEVAADSSQPQITAIDELLGSIHLKHLAHVPHLSLALLTWKINRGTGLFIQYTIIQQLGRKMKMVKRAYLSRTCWIFETTLIQNGVGWLK